jgi:hypothetical protein
MPTNPDPQTELSAARSRMMRATQAWHDAGGSDDAFVHELTDNQLLLMIQAVNAKKAYANLVAAGGRETIYLR